MIDRQSTDSRPTVASAAPVATIEGTSNDRGDWRVLPAALETSVEFAVPVPSRTTLREASREAQRDATSNEERALSNDFEARLRVDRTRWLEEAI